MNSKYLVRIVKSELMHFKNVANGEIRYMNYGSVEKRAEIEKKDLVWTKWFGEDSDGGSISYLEMHSFRAKNPI